MKRPLKSKLKLRMGDRVKYVNPEVTACYVGEIVHLSGAAAVIQTPVHRIAVMLRDCTLQRRKRRRV